MAAEHARMAELLGAWALDACEPDEARAVDAHLAGCRSCAAEASRLRELTGRLETGPEVPPAAGLRERMLTAATAARRPAPAAADVAPDYRVEIATLDRLLGELTPAQWRAPVLRNWSAQDLLAHLAASDAALAAQLGLPAAVAPGLDPAAATRAAVAAHRGRAPATTRAVWHRQAVALADHVPGPGELVDLAGRSQPARTYPDALLLRAFETWVHDGDLRAATGRLPRPPSGALPGRIASLGVELLPVALVTAGASRRDRTVRLRLTGSGGGEWAVPLAPSAAAGRPGAEVTLDVLEFCALMGARRRPGTLRHTVTGDPESAACLLRAAATLGCE